MLWKAPARVDLAVNWATYSVRVTAVVARAVV
jgi:hypothetical protein